MTNLTVTIENLSAQGGTFTTPVWVGFHDGNFDLFNAGEAASTEVERFAEDGNFDPLVASFGGTQGVLVGGNGVEGPLDPGEKVGMSFNVDGEGGSFLSYGTMLLPSNDAFLANDAADFWQIFNEDGEYNGDSSIIVSGNQVWDAGTEVNTETNAAFLDQTAPNTGEDEDGVVSVHTGFNGSAGNPDGTPVNILGGTTAAGNFIDPTKADFTLPNMDLLKISVFENKEIEGTREDDNLEGSGGADVLKGERGNDVLKGNDGNDTLYGGRGNDFLIAGGNEKFAVNFNTLNESGVTGNATLSLDGTNLTVHIDAEGFEPNMPHPQHIHGLENGGDSQTPTTANDTDGDGFIELAEGLPAYGPIALPLTSPQGAGLEGFPTASAGTIDFTETYSFDLSNADDQATFASLIPLENREIVLHGKSLGEDDGAGTEGEADGTSGYKAVLPVAAGEIESTSSNSGGNDLLFGGSDNDILLGDGGDDALHGDRGNDIAFGGAGDDELYGGRGNDSLYGSDGDDTINGGRGDDLLSGGEGSDTFVFDKHGGHDTIVDFTSEDFVTFDSKFFDSAQDAFDALEFADGNASIDSNVNSLTFVGVVADDFSASNFGIA